MHALLGIDLGTTGVKAALFAAQDGHVLSSAFVEYPLLHPQPGWAEQHPADWWQATVTAIRTCLAQAALRDVQDRKSTRLNSSHTVISYAVFCLKKKKPRINRKKCNKNMM